MAKRPFESKKPLTSLTLPITIIFILFELNAFASFILMLNLVALSIVAGYKTYGWISFMPTYFKADNEKIEYEKITSLIED